MFVMCIYGNVHITVYGQKKHQHFRQKYSRRQTVGQRRAGRVSDNIITASNRPVADDVVSLGNVRVAYEKESSYLIVMEKDIKDIIFVVCDDECVVCDDENLHSLQVITIMWLRYIGIVLVFSCTSTH